VCYLRSF